MASPNETMTFFSDALDGYLVNPETGQGVIVSDPVSPTERDVDRVVCVDKKVRTGFSSDSGNVAVRLTLPSGVSYDAVALVFRDASTWKIHPNGLEERRGDVSGSFRQFAYYGFSASHNGRWVDVELSPGAILQEIYVLKKFFSVLDEENGVRLERPMRYRNYATDPGEQAYRTEDQTLISYSGLSPYGKGDFRLGWDYLPRVWVDRFWELFYGPPLRKPFFFYPEPVERPNEVYRVYWRSCLDRPGERYREVPGFAPYPSAASLASGYTLDMNFIEI